MSFINNRHEHIAKLSKSKWTNRRRIMYISVAGFWLVVFYLLLFIDPAQLGLYAALFNGILTFVLGISTLYFGGSTAENFSSRSQNEISEMEYIMDQDNSDESGEG